MRSASYGAKCQQVAASFSQGPKARKQRTKDGERKSLRGPRRTRRLLSLSFKRQLVGRPSVRSRRLFRKVSSYIRVSVLCLISFFTYLSRRDCFFDPSLFHCLQLRLQKVPKLSVFVWVGRRRTKETAKVLELSPCN